MKIRSGRYLNGEDEKKSMQIYGEICSGQFLRDTSDVERGKSTKMNEDKY